MVLMIFVVGMVGVMNGAEEYRSKSGKTEYQDPEGRHIWFRSPNIGYDEYKNIRESKSYQPKWEYTSPLWPKTHARMVVRKGQQQPKGYVVPERDPDFEGKWGTDMQRYGAQVVEKEIVSGENEFWNQWVEGYEPKEKFEQKVQTRFGSYGKQKQYKDSLSPEVREDRAKQQRQEKAWLAGRMQEQARSQMGLMARFSNWLKSWMSTPAIGQSVPVRQARQ